VQIDTSTPTEPPGPTVTSVVASGSGITAGAGDLNVGAVVTFTVNMSAAVVVSGGTPTLSLNDNGVATYTGGSGTSALVFTYTVAAGQDITNLGITGFALNGATVATGAPTVTAGSGQTLTDANGNVFSFGGLASGVDYAILRNGARYASGAAATLALVNGVVWAYTAATAAGATLDITGGRSRRMPGPERLRTRELSRSKAVPL
jgi:hypothetical protein